MKATPLSCLKANTKPKYIERETISAMKNIRKIFNVLNQLKACPKFVSGMLAGDHPQSRKDYSVLNVISFLDIRISDNKFKTYL